MNFLSTWSPIDTLTGDLLAEAPIVPVPPSDEPAAEPAPAEVLDEWTENFVRTLQGQHARIREFLQSRSDRWRQIAARFTCQIEKLQAEVHALTAVNEDLRVEAATSAAAGNQPAEPPAAPHSPAGLRSGGPDEASQRYLMAMDDIRDLKARNADLQRQLLAAQAAPVRAGESAAPAAAGGGDWETQKRRLLAELESNDQHDAESVDRCLKIEEIIARTDKIIAEKDREIEELQYLLNNQSESIGSLAIGAAALEQVLGHDEMILEERQRLQQVQDELREKLRHAEIEHAMERARLARREAEIEERNRNMESHRAATAPDAEALAPTGRPVRGRWRTQMGLTDDGSPDRERRK